MASAHQFAYGWVTPVRAYLLSFVGSVLGLVATVRARSAPTMALRARWLVLAAFSIGGTGIWTMHFLAMIGFSVDGTPVRFDVPVTVARWIRRAGRRPWWVRRPGCLRRAERPGAAARPGPTRTESGPGTMGSGCRDALRRPRAARALEPPRRAVCRWYRLRQMDRSWSLDGCRRWRANHHPP